MQTPATQSTAGLGAQKQRNRSRRGTGTSHHRRNRKTGERKSLRSIAAELARLGYVNVHDRPFAAELIKAMVR